MTKKSDDEKGLLNEVLPDPTQAASDLRRGTPRERTAGHLKKILAAAAGLAFSGIAHGDTTTPPNKTGDKSGKKEGHSKEGKKEGNKKPPPQPPPYGVVDPLPEPYVEEKVGPGWLKVESDPAGAAIVIDGKATGKTTPMDKLELNSGRHTISVQLDGYQTINTVVTIRADQNHVWRVKLEPPPKK